MNVLNSYDGFSLLVLQMALWPDWNALSLYMPEAAGVL